MRTQSTVSYFSTLLELDFPGPGSGSGTGTSSPLEFTLVLLVVVVIFFLLLRAAEGCSFNMSLYDDTDKINIRYYQK